MAGEIVFAVNALREALDLGKAILKGGVAAEVAGNIHEVQAKLSEALVTIAQLASEQAAIQDRCISLEAQLKGFEDWEAQKRSYKLEEIAAGVFAYSYEAEGESSEPAHKICAHCYESRFKSILQNHTGEATIMALLCPNCNHVFRVDPRYGATEAIPL